MTSESLIDRIREIVRTEGDIDGAAIDENLFDAGLSSFAVVRVLVALEDELGIELPDDEDVYASFTTLQRIGTLVEWRLSGRQPTAD